MTPLAMRLSKTSLPARLATGDARLDAHLAALDAALTGFPAVRRETVLEAREFLLDARDHAREAGLDDEAAAKEAIAQLGPIEDIAREQRAARGAIFRRFSFIMGLSFAGMMLLMSLLRTGWAAADGLALAGTFAFQAGFFGITMGYLVAYVVPRAQPAVEDAPAPGSFRVHFGPASVAAAWAIAAVFGLGGVLHAAALAGHGPFASWSPALGVILLLMCLRVTLGALRAARFRALADDQALHIDGLFGRARIARSAITGTELAARPMQLLLPAMGPSHWIHWRDEGGRARRTSVAVAGELVHGDRLIAWLEAAARANALSPAGAPARPSAP
jgi:hypothetical protein